VSNITSNIQVPLWQDTERVSEKALFCFFGGVFWWSAGAAAPVELRKSRLIQKKQQYSITLDERHLLYGAPLFGAKTKVLNS
jgi:hypothetical protein